MSELLEQYKEKGIWTMDTDRSTCVLPEQPLFISRMDEKALNQLSLSVWKSLENVIENQKSQEAMVYPEGLTMPPAIRVDTVLTDEGPKIIEIDPVSAISLGETLSLMDIWSAHGYLVPNGLLTAITDSIRNKNMQNLDIFIPKEKFQYTAELSFLGKKLQESGIDITDQSPVMLSAFSDIPSLRKQINRQGWLRDINPLWGSLSAFADKTNLSLLQSGDKRMFPQFLPMQFKRNELSSLDPDEVIVAKPAKGSESNGVKALSVKEAVTLPNGYVFQEVLRPRTDTFGMNEDKAYVSRVSVYASRYGLVGAQVTARPSTGRFTNVHGQADAIQTTIAINENER